MPNIYLKQYIWDKKTFKLFSNSCNHMLNIYNIQSYNPILSLYLYYHNTKHSKKLLTIYLKNIQ